MSKKIALSCLALALLVVLSPPADASDFGFFGTEIRGGAVFPDDFDTGFTVGLAFNVAELADGLYLYPALNYSEADDSRRVVLPFDAVVDVDFEVSDISVGAEVRYYPSGEERGFYFGGGPYYHFLEVDASAQTNFPFPIIVTGSADTDELGGTAVAGWRFDSGRSAYFVEGRYVVVSDFDSAQALIGISF